MKKIILIILISLLFFGFTPYDELNDLAVVDVIGITYKDNAYYLYLNVINNDNKVYKVKGKSLGEVFFKARNIDNKKTYYNHLSIVIFDTNILKNNYNDVLSYFKDEFSFIDYLVLTTNDDIDNLFKKYHKQKDYKNFILKEKKETGKIIDITFKELLSNNLDKEKTSYIPLINIDKKLISNGIYVINKDLILNEEISKTIYLLNDKINEYSENIKINNNYYQVYLNNIKTSINYKDNELEIKITANINSPDTNNLNLVKKDIKKDIKNNINNLIDKEIDNKINLSNLINYINLESNNKNLYNTYKKSKKKIIIKLKEERKLNYDK